jgi:acetylornithine deacetylase
LVYTKQHPFKRENNNVWAFNQHFDAKTYAIIEFSPRHGKPKSIPMILFKPLKRGLIIWSSNDAGGCLVLF